MFASRSRNRDGKNFRPVNEEQTGAVLEVLKNAEFKVTSREDKPTQTKPTAPYITSTLQQAASTRLGYGVKKTMMMAQRLYEAGYITYMRTDSTNLSSEAVAGCRDLIVAEYGKQYLPDEPRLYSSKEGAQEAHEAIRPSDAGVKSPSSRIWKETQSVLRINLASVCSLPDAECRLSFNVSAGRRRKP